MKAVLIHPDALAEAAEASRYLEKQLEGLGADFLSAVEEAIDAIRAFPDRYPLVDSKHRRVHTRRFPYSVVYVVDGNVVRVKAVMHQRRRPFYWRRRRL